MSTVTLKRIFVKSKSWHANAQLATGARHYFDKNNKIPGSSHIYDSEGPIALSLGLIILRGQYILGHEYATEMPWSRRPGKTPGARHGNVWTCYNANATQPVISESITFVEINKSREQFLLRLTFFTLFTANGWNFPIFTAVD